MLSSLFRFKGSKEISIVRKEGAVYQGRFFVAKYLKVGDCGSLFATVVSAKISKKATRRNKIKRRIYEIIRQNLAETEGLKYGVHCVFFVRSAALEADFQEIRLDTNNFLKSIIKAL